MALSPTAISISIQSKVDKVQAVVQDPYYTDEIVLGIFNDLLLDIAGGIEIEDKRETRISPPLPDLFTSGTFTASKDAVYAAMPTGYQRGFKKLVNASGLSIPIYDNIEALLAVKPLMNEAGAVRICALKGKNLYYQGKPVTANEALTAYYHRIPYAMALADTAVDGIPDFLVHRLFVNGACYRIYDEIEDGTEGNKASTKRYGELFTQGLISLEKWVPVDGDSIYINKTPYDTGGVLYR